MNKIKLVVFAIVSFAFKYAEPVKNAYTLSEDYQVIIKGTSNIHSWSEKVETVTGDGTVNLNKDGSFDLETISIKMNVHSIKSDLGVIMNNNTYKALKADANPQIVFSLAEPVKSIQPEPQEKMIAVKGNLTIAGVTKVINMKVKIRLQEYGKLSFEGRQLISMSDYDVKPPIALFGTLKTGNEIIISFKTNFILKQSLLSVNSHH